MTMMTTKSTTTTTTNDDVDDDDDDDVHNPQTIQVYGLINQFLLSCKCCGVSRSETQIL